MRIPQAPPPMKGLKKIEDVLLLATELPPSRRYRHWDKIRRLNPPEGFTHEEWWFAIKFNRSPRYTIELLDLKGKAFSFSKADPIGEYLHEIDRGTASLAGTNDPIGNPTMSDRYLVHSLIEEAITSSQLEGAATTRRVAKEMIRSGRSPRDRGELMILNNYLAMQEIGKLADKDLSPSMLFHLHKIVTSGTLDDPADAGQFRSAERSIEVGDPMDATRVFHRPPSADQLDHRMHLMCAFANGGSSRVFVHPVIRSIILHFWLAYDHPFVDGNGRTARTLFYWSMRRHKYWICEFISISEMIRRAPARYGRAFLYTETDDNDLTYFILYHLDLIRRAIRALKDYVERKTKELLLLERRMRAVSLLNHRQQAIIGHALRNPEHRYTIESHQRSHNVVYQTARTDLLDLAKRGFFRSWKVGKEWQFQAVDDLEERLREPG